MTFLKWYSIIILALVDLMLFDEYVKERNKVTLISFMSILPIVLYLLVRW